MRILASLGVLALAACANPTERPYHLPYAAGTEVLVTNDHRTHSTPEAEMFDMQATQSNQTLVAAAPGWIREVEDSKDSSSPTNNYVWIEHPLDYCQPPGGITTQPTPPSDCRTCPQGVGKCNEWTLYAHMQQGSVSGLGLAPGSWVNEGQPIGIEGDVGYTPCGGSRRADCGRHLHFTVFTIDRTTLAAANQPTDDGDYEDWAKFEVKFGSGQRPERVPLFCTADGLRLVRAGQTYVAGPCPPLN
jgi:hypothetical protein